MKFKKKYPEHLCKETIYLDMRRDDLSVFLVPTSPFKVLATCRKIWFFASLFNPMSSEVLERFVDKSTVTEMARELLENLLCAEKLDRWFEATRGQQYTPKLLFSSLVGLMLQVVCRTRASVHGTYRAATIAASIVAVYGKLQGIKPTTSRAFVQFVAGQAERLIETLGGARPELLPG
jgi:hypothetical protein